MYQDVEECIKKDIKKGINGDTRLAGGYPLRRVKWHAQVTMTRTIYKNK